MKKATMIFAVALVGMFMLGGVALAADKFSYVNLSKIFSEYNKTKDYDKILTDKESVYTTERDKKVNDVKQLQDKISLLSDKEKEPKQKELTDKVKSLREFDSQKQTELRKEQDTKMKDILKDIEETVKKYSEQEGYTMVFNDRVLVYETKSLDITDKIVDLLNKQYKK